MSTHVLLTFALLTGAPPEAELCRSIPNRIEPDMRIQESDLTREKAAQAATELAAMIERGEVDEGSQFGALNRLKIIKGHVLLRQTQVDRKTYGPISPEARDSTKSFCDWLVNEGFWHD